MTTIYNIRGTNGSGKTTVARSFLSTYPVDLSAYHSPTKRDPAKMRRYPGTINEDAVLLLGSYATACGGMDKHPAGKGFAVPQEAIRYALTRIWGPKLKAIICEGVLASGVYGSWHEFAQELEREGHTLAFVYLHTPADICLERIRDRQRAAGKEPAPPGTPEYDRMVENVTGKWKGTMATRDKAIRDDHVVYDIPDDASVAVAVMQDIVAGKGEQYRVR